jgi:Mg-chelatase subunit ChlD/quinol monooxygenase YgiN
MLSHLAAFNRACSISPSFEGLINHRLDGKKFGGVTIVTPPIDLTQRSRQEFFLFGCVLDTSASMAGNKIANAVRTIRNMVECLLQERQAKTNPLVSIHSWIYLMTFSSDAKLVIPFTEISEQTLQEIHSGLSSIVTNGSTSYEAAFKMQMKVLGEIVDNLSVCQEMQHFHVVRIFLTDGEITAGTSEVSELYPMMRAIDTTVDLSTSLLRTSFENIVISYGTDVDLTCLQKLAFPWDSKESSYSVSSLITIIKPEDIGFKIGETLFGLFTRVGVEVSMTLKSSEGQVELFDCASNSWLPKVTFNSLVANTSKTVWFQCLESIASVHLIVTWKDLQTGCTSTYQSQHDVVPALDDQNISILIGMLQLEGFKLYAAIQSGSISQETILLNAYRSIENVKELMTKKHSEEIACKLENLLEDLKLIVGLTTISNPREQAICLYDRRICSGENQFYNSGKHVSQKYVEGEETFVNQAMEALQKWKEHHPEDIEFFSMDSDYLPSVPLQRTPTVLPIQRIHSEATEYSTGSNLRELCALMAASRLTGDATPVDELLEQMVEGRRAYNDEMYDGEHVFSSIPSSNPTAQRCMGLMRQMSSDPRQAVAMAVTSSGDNSPSKRHRQSSA